MKRSARLHLSGSLLVLALVATGCGGSSDSASSDASAPGAAEASPAQDGPVTIIASTDVYGSIATAIGGDAVEVTSIIDNPSTDPHDYESTPRDAAVIADASIAIGNGGGYDDFFFKLADSAGGERTVIDVAKLSGLEDKVPDGEEFNEHMWFNLPTMQKLADQLATDMSALRPDQSSTFEANAKDFNAKVDELMQEVEAIGTKHPGARVAATEPLPLYLLDEAGLENVTPEEFMEASEEGTDAPAAVVQETLKEVAGDEPVKALLLNTQTQNAATDRLREAANKAGVPEVGVSETLSDGQTQYVDWLGGQVEALATALDKG